jgi:hypothetical protein
MGELESQYAAAVSECEQPTFVRLVACFDERNDPSISECSRIGTQMRSSVRIGRLCVDSDRRNDSR